MSTRYKGSVLSATAATNSQSAAVGIWRPNEVLQAVNASLWPLGIIYDPYFEYVTLLLHGDGTNGAQNNTFLDSSTNNFTITRNGNTTQGTFTPYGPNWSNYFDGTGDYLTVASNSVLNGTAFTLEGWFYYNAAGVTDTILCASSTSGGITLAYQTASAWGIAAAGVAYRLTTTTLPTVNAWNHIAISRAGTGTNQTSIFLNGTRVANGTVTDTFSVTGTFLIAWDGNAANKYFNGYISNFRFVNSDVYGASNTSITVPTTPLSAITGTQLLTCQSNRFKDSSTNNLTITRSGDVTIQRFSPFSPPTAYSTSVIGGSGYFDGSADYLSLTQSTAMSLGTGDFTVEAWVYPTVNPSGPGFWSIIDARGSSSAIPWAAGLRLVTGNLKATFYNGADIQGTITVYLNTWTHIAFARSGTTLKSFVNGVLDINTTMSTNLNVTGTQYIGALIDPAYDTGYLSDLRVVKGTAVYTAAFTPPTAPLTAITNTQLLLNYTNAGIYDNAMMNDLETVGNAQVSTTQVKFGTGSMKFNSTTDLIKGAATPIAGFGTGNFTVECWIYVSAFSNATGYMGIFSNRSTPGGSQNSFDFGIQNSSSKLYFYDANGAGTTTLSTGTLSATTWTYVALVRSGSTITFYINGSASGTLTNSANFGSNNTLYVGANANTSPDYYNGYIDDLRITKGYARTITTPTTAFPNQ